MVGSLDDVRVGIVGLPLAVAFARSIDVVGFDIREARIDELKRGVDPTREVPSEKLAAAKGLTFSAESVISSATMRAPTSMIPGSPRTRRAKKMASTWSISPKKAL